MLYLIKRCRSRHNKNTLNPKNEQREVQKTLEEIDTWKKKYNDLEKYVSKMMTNNEKVTEDNNYLRVELIKTRYAKKGRQLQKSRKNTELHGAHF